MSIERQLQDLRNRDVPQFDPSALQAQIGGLQQQLGNIPQFDDSALRDRLQALEGREIPQFDPSQLQAGIQGLSDRISNLPQFDPSALQNRLSELENRQAPTFNPDDFREQFLNIAREGIDIPQPTQAFDPSGLQNRLQALENREMPQFDPSRLQERLSALENVQPVAPTPAFDPSSLQARLDALENREPVAAPPAFDPSGLMARLDDFESRLGALQQPLPIQPPGDTDLGIKEGAPDIRDFAKPLPGGGTIFDEVPNSGISPPRPPKPVEQDFGFGPGIRPSEIITPDGEFVGSGGVTRPQPPQDDRLINDGPKIGNYGLERQLFPELRPIEGGGMPIPSFEPPQPSLPIEGPPLRGSEITLGRLPGETAEEYRARTDDGRNITIPVSGAGTNFRPEPPMSIGGPGATPTGGVKDMLARLTGGPIPGRGDLVFPGGSPTFNERGETFVPPENLVSDRPPDSNYIDMDSFLAGARPNFAELAQPAPDTDPVPDPIPQPATDPTVTAPTTTTAPQVAGGTPFAAGVTQVATGLDPLTEQLLFGIGGQGGFIPGAMRAAEKVFYDDQGNPVVIDEQVAGFSPDQLQAMQMQREALGMQNPYLQGAGQAFGAGTQALEEGLQRGRTAAIGALEATKGGVGSLQEGLGESADILRGTLGGYDPSMTDRFYDPFEDRVVQQTIEDIMEQGAKSDIGARASDIARGGESAFGSRARLGAGERQEALGRGLAEALGGIRSRGFREAQQTGLGEFARQKAAERAASTGLASLAGQGFGGSQALAGALSGLGQTEQDIGQQRYSGQFGLGTSLQGLGAQAAGASASDIAALYGMGSQQQGQAQAMLDAQRRNLQQRQMTPLLQYQALAPFISMAPAGQFTTTTQFAPPPSPMQAGLGVGLSAFGALGQLYGGGK